MDWTEVEARPASAAPRAKAALARGERGMRAGFDLRRRVGRLFGPNSRPTRDCGEVATASRPLGEARSV